MSYKGRLYFMDWFSHFYWKGKWTWAIFSMLIRLYVYFFRIFYSLADEEGIVCLIEFRLLREIGHCSYWHFQRDIAIPDCLINWTGWRECKAKIKKNISRNQKLIPLTEFYLVPSPAKKSYDESSFQLL